MILQDKLSSMDKDKIKIHHNERCYDGFFRIDKLIFDHPTFNKETITNVTREVINRLDAVAVLPYDPITDKILLIRQLRIAAYKKTKTPWVIELIAGLVDHDNESFIHVAEREAKEEAGLKISNLTPIHEFFTSVGGSNEKTYLFVALCDLENTGGLFGLPEENEDIEAFTVSREEALQMVQKGIIETASTIIAIQWLALNYQRYKTTQGE